MQVLIIAAWNAAPLLLAARAGQLDHVLPIGSGAIGTPGNQTNIQAKIDALNYVPTLT